MDRENFTLLRTCDRTFGEGPCLPQDFVPSSTLFDRLSWLVAVFFLLCFLYIITTILLKIAALWGTGAPPSFIVRVRIWSSLFSFSSH